MLYCQYDVSGIVNSVYASECIAVVARTASSVCSFLFVRCARCTACGMCCVHDVYAATAARVVYTQQLSNQ
jgi:hypothetical protein